MIGTPPAPPAIDESTRLRSNSAASWGAILAGAVVAVSLSLVLVTLGAGLGFASVSPWSEHGLSATSFTVAGTIWLIVTQWLSAAAGGYSAGRLRQRWLATHTHEVFFRDTAHGLVTWGVATLFIVAVLVSSVGRLVSGGARVASSLSAEAAPAVSAVERGDPRGSRGPTGPDPLGPNNSYNMDKLFRSSSATSPDPSGPGGQDGDLRIEVTHMITNVAPGGSVNDDDRAYLSAAVARKTGLPPDEAQKRVDAFIQSVKDTSAQSKAAADEARKAAAAAALFTALSLLIGAFIASVSAAIGGRLRDEHLQSKR
jgi:hypothetical protein